MSNKGEIKIRQYDPCDFNEIIFIKNSKFQRLVNFKNIKIREKDRRVILYLSIV